MEMNKENIFLKPHQNSTELWKLQMKKMLTKSIILSLLITKWGSNFKRLFRLEMVRNN